MWASDQSHGASTWLESCRIIEWQCGVIPGRRAQEDRLRQRCKAVLPRVTRTHWTWHRGGPNTASHIFKTDIRPIPLVKEHTEYSEAGPLTIGVEYRLLADDISVAKPSKSRRSENRSRSGEARFAPRITRPSACHRSSPPGSVLGYLLACLRLARGRGELDERGLYIVTTQYRMLNLLSPVPSSGPVRRTLTAPARPARGGSVSRTRRAAPEGSS